LKPGKTKLEKKRGIHVGLLTQGGALLAGYYHVVPTGLGFGSDSAWRSWTGGGGAEFSRENAQNARRGEAATEERN
jgi:hypothetical protein